MKTDGVICVVNLAQALSINELPLENRSDRWWDEFWRFYGLQEAQRIKERYENDVKSFTGRK